MYENLFGFRRRPFVSVPDVELYYPGETAEAARQTLIRGIERGEGPGLLLGPSGTGKTLLCKLLALHFERRVPVALLCAGRFGSRGDLLRTILYELGQPYRGLHEGETRIALVDYLTSREDSPSAALILVDEAHTLPLKLLDELRMLGNLSKGISPAVRLVLAGGMVLEEHLANPKLECLSQRIATRCYLEPFDGCETSAYINSQVDAVRGPSGRSADVFSEKAARAVFQATDGVPRVVNQVCDHALLLAYNKGKTAIGAADVEEAWAELQQLPSPWNDEPAETSGVIEFGSLEDDPEDLTPACGKAPKAKEPPQLQILTGSCDEEELESAEDVTPLEASFETEEEELGGCTACDVPIVRALNPFAEAFEKEEVVIPRPAVAGSLCGEFDSDRLSTPIVFSQALRAIKEKAGLSSQDGSTETTESESESETECACDAASEGVRPTRPVSVAFQPSFPLPEFSWPDPQYGYSPLPRSKPVRGPVPGMGHLKRPG